jgi:hypothetical protein
MLVCCSHTSDLCQQRPNYNTKSGKCMSCARNVEITGISQTTRQLLNQTKYVTRSFTTYIMICHHANQQTTPSTSVYVWWNVFATRFRYKPLFDHVCVRVLQSHVCAYTNTHACTHPRTRSIKCTCTHTLCSYIHAFVY